MTTSILSLNSAPQENKNFIQHMNTSFLFGIISSVIGISAMISPANAEVGINAILFPEHSLDRAEMCLRWNNRSQRPGLSQEYSACKTFN